MRHYRGRPHFLIILLIVTCVGCAAVGGMVLFMIPSTWILGMGRGSPEHAQKWREAFADITDPEMAKARYPEVACKRFKNGEWIFGISEDSHESPSGGTMVVKDSTGRTRVFFGHVCGPGFLQFMLKTPVSLEEFYGQETFTQFWFQEYTGP